MRKQVTKRRAEKVGETRINGPDAEAEFSYQQLRTSFYIHRKMPQSASACGWECLPLFSTI